LFQIAGVSLNHIDNIGEGELLAAIAERMAVLPVGSFEHEAVELDGYVRFLGLHGVMEGQALSLDEAREDIEPILLEEQYGWLHRKWLDQLKRRAYCGIL
jgi:hypothetical protein